MDAVRILDEHRGDAVIVTTMNAGNVRFGLPSVTKRDELNLPLVNCMGKASSIGLGLALARPERKVLVLDGDGSLLMNLGTLVTISDKAPESLYHFVFDNGVYAAAFEFNDTEELATSIDAVLQQKGPVLVCLKIVPEIENTPIHLRPPPARKSVQQAKVDLAREFGL